MFFGQRKKAAAPDQSGNGGGNSADKGNIEYPWHGEDFAPCNFALGHLRDNLPDRISHGGRIHAETYVSSIGCIAGFASQAAAFEKMAQRGIPFSPPYLNTIGTKNGKTYYFGDAQNMELYNFWEGDAPGCGLWPLCAGAATVCGITQQDIPPIKDMFAHIASQIGSEKVQLRVGGQGQPILPPEELLNVVWPLALMCFNGKFPNSQHEFGIANKKYRPIIASFLANSIIQQVKDVLPADIALTIVMESAILCSKVDPKTVKSGF